MDKCKSCQGSLASLKMELIGFMDNPKLKLRLYLGKCPHCKSTLVIRKESIKNVKAAEDTDIKVS